MCVCILYVCVCQCVCVIPSFTHLLFIIFISLQTALSEKVNVSDLSSLMPSTDGSEGANFMPKLLEIQNKITQLEGNSCKSYPLCCVFNGYPNIHVDEIGKQPPLPSDLLDKIIGMQNAIDHLSAELNRVTIL